MFNLSGLAPLRQASVPTAAFMVGHAFGLHGVPCRMPYTFNEIEQADFRDGWQAGDCERRPGIVNHADAWTSPDPTASDDGDYATMRLADLEASGIRPDDEAPDFLALLETNDEYYSRLAAEEEPDEWTVEEWNRKGEAFRGRVVHQVELERMGRVG